MAYTESFVVEADEPVRSDVDIRPGPWVLEFGAPWCGHCRRAQPLVQAAFAANPGVSHQRIEDGPGRRLGRTFRVKMWPTLIFLRDGVEVTRLVRPDATTAIAEALAAIDRR